jgi:hypothetical protein
MKKVVRAVLMRLKKGKSWSKHEDELLIAFWLHNSCDSVRGNSKRGDNYYKEVAAELNKYATKEEKKTVMQCKNHWTKTTKKVTKFNAIYNVERTMWLGFSPLHKCTASIRTLAYGTPADLFDENLRMAESTVIECMVTMCKGVIENFSPKFLRRPTNEDVERLLVVGKARGFPGMLGSLDCMHWTWRACPTSYKGMFT